MRAREAALGRTARPFRLTITEIPVDGLVRHRLAPGHVLVSSRFAADLDRREAGLADLIVKLA